MISWESALEKRAPAQVASERGSAPVLGEPSPDATHQGRTAQLQVVVAGKGQTGPSPGLEGQAPGVLYAEASEVALLDHLACPSWFLVQVVLGQRSWE